MQSHEQYTSDFYWPLFTFCGRMFSSFSIKKKQRRRAVSSASTRPHGHGTEVVAGGGPGRRPSVQWLQANGDGPKVMFIVRCLLVDVRFSMQMVAF